LIILRNKIKIIFKGSIYRISGDEFVCLYKGNKIDLLLITFNENIVNSFEMGILFFGVSIGYAKFPQDANTLEELITKADSAMYKEKKQVKKIFRAIAMK